MRTSLPTDTIEALEKKAQEERHHLSFLADGATRLREMLERKEEAMESSREHLAVLGEAIKEKQDEQAEANRG